MNHAKCTALCFVLLIAAACSEGGKADGFGESSGSTPESSDAGAEIASSDGAVAEPDDTPGYELVAEPMSRRFSVSPDGQWIAVFETEPAYLAPLADIGSDGVSEPPASAVFVPEGPVASAAWSPDSTRVVLDPSDSIAEGEPNQLLLFGIDGQLSVLVPQDEEMIRRFATWSSADRLVFENVPRQERNELSTPWWTVDLGGEPQPLGTPDGNPVGFVPSLRVGPDAVVGYAVESDEARDPVLFRLDIDGSSLELLPGTEQDAEAEPGLVIDIAGDLALVRHGAEPVETQLGDAGDYTTPALVDLTDGTRLPLRFGSDNDGIDGPLDAELSPSGDRIALVMRQRVDGAVVTLVHVYRTESVWDNGGFEGVDHTEAVVPFLSDGANAVWRDSEALMIVTERAVLRIDL